MCEAKTRGEREDGDEKGKKEMEDLLVHRVCVCCVSDHRTTGAAVVDA